MAAITSYDMDTLPPLVSITAATPVPVMGSAAIGVPLLMAMAAATAAAALATAVVVVAVVVVTTDAAAIESAADTVFDSDSSCSRDLFGTLPYRTAVNNNKLSESIMPTSTQYCKKYV